MNWFFVLLVLDFVCVVVASSVGRVCQKIPLWAGPLVVPSLFLESGTLLLKESVVLTFQ